MKADRLQRASEAVENAVRSLFTETEWVSFTVEPDVDEDGEDMLLLRGTFRGSGDELLSSKIAGLPLALWDFLVRIEDPMLVLPELVPHGETDGD